MVSWHRMWPEFHRAKLLQGPIQERTYTHAYGAPFGNSERMNVDDAEHLLDIR